jgi:hypothetical protein|nr:MAG TPA: hypothetical protein [Ackermannviridae sp.]
MKQKKTIYLVGAVVLLFVITVICVKSCNGGSDKSITDTTALESTVVDSISQDSLESVITIEQEIEAPLKVDSSKFPDYVYSYEYIEVYEKFKPLLSAIAHVESRGIPNMVSKSGKYKGLLQQSRINVDDCNLSTDYAFKYEDRLDPKKAVQMFLITQKKYNKKMSYEMACRIWSRHDISGTDPEAGRYWERVKKELDKHDYSPLWEK